MIRQTLNFAYYRQNLFRLHLLVDRSQSSVLDVIKGRLVPTLDVEASFISPCIIQTNITVDAVAKFIFSTLPFRY